MTTTANDPHAMFAPASDVNHGDAGDPHATPMYEPMTGRIFMGAPTTPTVKEVLATAAELVRDGWSTGTNARDANGEQVSYNSPEAANFCMYGAILRAAHDADVHPGAALTVAYRQLPANVKWLSQFNDQLKQSAEAVADALQRAANS